MTMLTNSIMIEVGEELERAQKLHNTMPTYHHGHSVIEEELLELFEEIRKKPINVENLRKEAIHIAATAVRFVHDLCSKEYVNA